MLPSLRADVKKDHARNRGQKRSNVSLVDYILIRHTANFKHLELIYLLALSIKVKLAVLFESAHKANTYRCSVTHGLCA